MAKKRKEKYVDYDYEAAYSRQIQNLEEHEAQTRKKGKGSRYTYALKEIKSGEQLEVEMYPQFRGTGEVPPEGRRSGKGSSAAQKNLNDKNARKYVERLINHNFDDGDLWITFTYDDAHLPPDGDVDAAERNMENFIRRINRRRKKRGLPNCHYLYVTEYSRTGNIRWHHHLVMDGMMEMDEVEKCWKHGGRNEIRKLKKDERGLSGMAAYIVKEKERLKSEKRWKSSKGLAAPDVRVVHSKQPEKGKGNYRKIAYYIRKFVKDHEDIGKQMERWYPDHDLTETAVYWNDFNGMYYIRARMRKKKKMEKDGRTGRKTEYEAGKCSKKRRC